MKKLLLTTGALLCAASVFAQGTVVFDNNLTGQVITRVYLGGTSQVRGLGTGDTPAGTQDWTGFTALTGSGYSAAILAGPATAAETSLTFGATPTITTFRGGGNAGRFAQTTATINSIAVDAASASLEVFVWSNVGGTLTDPATALAAFRAGTLTTPAGLSGAFTVAAIGGGANTPPAMVGLQSFNIFTAVPEPSSMALAGLAAASLLIFRRRK